jgi:Raf kinase inhibitor-like YbhB/YbcL family protein
MKSKYLLILIFAVVVCTAVFIILQYTQKTPTTMPPSIPEPIAGVINGAPASIHVYSSSFSNGSRIPVKHVYCGGDNVSPGLVVEDTPIGTRSVVLIMYDPDAPSGVFYHWVVYGLRGDRLELREGASKNTSLLQGLNSYGFVGYGGPCPPQGDREHRYVFLVIALDIDTSSWPYWTNTRESTKWYSRTRSCIWLYTWNLLKVSKGLFRLDDHMGHVFVKARFRGRDVLEPW